MTEHAYTISDEEIDALNAARTVLKALQDRTRHEYAYDATSARAYHLGRVENCYAEAARAIFEALNATRAYLGVDIADDTLFMREVAR